MLPLLSRSARVVRAGEPQNVVRPMKMSLNSCQPVPMMLTGVILSLGFVAPIGLLVLRRHLAKASDGRRVLKAVLIALTVVTSPLALASIVLVIRGGAEASVTLWSLLARAW